MAGNVEGDFTIGSDNAYCAPPYSSSSSKYFNGLACEDNIAFTMSSNSIDSANISYKNNVPTLKTVNNNTVPQTSLHNTENDRHLVSVQYCDLNPLGSEHEAGSENSKKKVVEVKSDALEQVVQDGGLSAWLIIFAVFSMFFVKVLKQHKRLPKINIMI